MKRIALALFALTLIAAPALAQENMTTHTSQTTTINKATTTTMTAPTPRVRSAAEADALIGGSARSNGAATVTASTFNDDEKNDRPYVLFWPDWYTGLETPANFNK